MRCRTFVPVMVVPSEIGRVVLFHSLELTFLYRLLHDFRRSLNAQEASDALDNSMGILQKQQKRIHQCPSTLKLHRLGTELNCTHWCKPDHSWQEPGCCIQRPKCAYKHEHLRENIRGWGSDIMSLDWETSFVDEASVTGSFQSPQPSLYMYRKYLN